jgi:hypothetical protein
MPLESVDLSTLDDVYNFVEAAVTRTGLILHDDAMYRPWVRAVAASVPGIAWFYPARPLSQEFVRHLCNFGHSALVEKGFILIESGRVVRVVDVDAVGGVSEPHRLADVVRAAFNGRNSGPGSGGTSGLQGALGGDPYAVLGATVSDSDEEIKKKYKVLIMEYHPDRVAHLGAELRDLATKKTTAINTAYAAIRKQRGF